MQTDDRDRGTGRTIRAVLRTLMECSKYPNEWMEVVDHWPGRMAAEAQADWICRTGTGFGMSMERQLYGKGFRVRYRKD